MKQYVPRTDLQHSLQHRNIREEDWVEISNILDEKFCDEMKEETKPEFVATKIDTEGYI
ncbi:hypothetical protein DPMN_029408 [Dreissena polymorpha]|uniref:Uncharacterized protein n=1 Tax=Dreissena polymorpha TaxID=45954 RepID=A0A9D4LYI5_DREPO|nr:hypothetical protein DPMN_029408 [Dreissena polymorpha]